MHLLLGMIFESKGIWGSENEPRSAIFQWTLALRAEEQVARLGPDKTYRAAGLHERLGLAYRESNNPSKAFDHYLKPGEAHVARGDRKSASANVESAKGLRFTPTNAQITSCRIIEEKIKY